MITCSMSRLRASVEQVYVIVPKERVKYTEIILSEQSKQRSLTFVTDLENCASSDFVLNWFKVR